MQEIASLPKDSQQLSPVVLQQRSDFLDRYKSAIQAWMNKQFNQGVGLPIVQDMDGCYHWLNAKKRKILDKQRLKKVNEMKRSLK